MRYLSLLVLLFLASYVSAQKNVVDKIVAIVGEEIVLKSDIENQLLHEQSQTIVNSTKDARARIFENLLVQKLLVAQAKIDSVTVTDTEVENALNSQLDQYVRHIGSRERLDTYQKRDACPAPRANNHPADAIEDREQRAGNPLGSQVFLPEIQ